MALFDVFPALKPPRALLGLIETAANRALDADPDITPKVDALNAKVLNLKITGLGLECFILISNGQFVFFETFNRDADVVLSAPPFALATMGITGEPNADVHFSGDTHTAQQFQNLLQSLDLDWEELLSRNIGDVAARQAGLMAKQFSGWLSRSNTSLSMATRDYLQEEVRHTPTKIEVENFSDDVDTLRMDVDRLEAKIKQLKR